MSSTSHSTRKDIISGALLLAATATALVLANSAAAPWYRALRDATFGFAPLHLDLSFGAWAADGLLAIFFFVVGLELKEEIVTGTLRNPRTAAVPVVAAVGGVVVPAVVYLMVNTGNEAHGWAIPTATDIAFAVAIIAVVGRHLPPALRVFLLTLAVVDDLIAITIIATFYTDTISLPWLTLALLPLAGFAVMVQKDVRAWWILLPLAVAVWVCVHASGIHATVAGVLLGMMVPVRAQSGAPGLASLFADRWRPVSSFVAVPVFAFFAAGVSIGGWAGLVAAASTPVTVGVLAGLVLGKPVGILMFTWIATRLPGISLDPTVKPLDLAGLSFVAGVGFTVSLLVGELAFGQGTPSDEHAKVGVITGSFIAGTIGSILLLARNRAAGRTHYLANAATNESTVDR